MSENPNRKDPQLAVDVSTVQLAYQDSAIKAAFIAGITAVPAEIDFAANQVVRWDFSRELRPWMTDWPEAAYKQWRDSIG